MLGLAVISGIALAYIIYQNFNQSQNNLDEKINYYDKTRGNIDEDIQDYKNKIEELKEERKNIDGKLTVLLTKKIKGFNKDYEKFNEKSVKKIKHIINFYGEGNEEMENNIYNNIESVIDVKQVKECDDTDYDSTDDEPSDIDSEDEPLDKNDSEDDSSSSDEDNKSEDESEDESEDDSEDDNKKKDPIDDSKDDKTDSTEEVTKIC